MLSMDPCLRQVLMESLVPSQTSTISACGFQPCPHLRPPGFPHAAPCLQICDSWRPHYAPHNLNELKSDVSGGALFTWDDHLGPNDNIGV